MNDIYEYDSAGRLLNVRGDLAQSFRYDTLGNMIFNSAVGTYTYPVPGPTAVRPHAVKQAGRDHLSYDANGSISSVKSDNSHTWREITWNADVAPASVSSSTGRRTLFGYDASGAVYGSPHGATCVTTTDAFSSIRRQMA